MPSALLLCVLLFSIILRFYHVEERGLDGSDTVFYTTIAKAWSEGNFIYQVAGRDTGYRPVVFFVYAAAIKLFGYHDSSIKKMNAAVDVVNVLLIFLLCFLLVRDSVIPAFAASMCYGFLPLAIHMARIELTHMLSGLFVLLACTAFVAYFISTKSWPKHFFLVLTGMFVVLGSLTHEDLILLGPGYLLFLLLVFIQQGSPRKHLRSLVISGVLLAAMMVIAAYNMLLHNIDLPRSALPAGPLEQVVIGYIEKALRLVNNAILGNSSSLVLGITLLLLLMLCVRPFSRKVFPGKKKSTPLPVVYFLPLTLILTYFASFAYFRNGFFIRLFLPLFPLLLIFLAVCWYTLLRRISRTVARVVVLTSVVLIMLCNLEYFHTWPTYMRWDNTTWAPARAPTPFKLGLGYQRFLQSTYSTSWARVTYEQLREHVSSDARVLITSSIMYPWPGRRILQLGYYFGDNAIYLIDHTEPLEQVIATYNIKYVLFSYYHAENRLPERQVFTKYEYGGQWKAGEELYLGASYGFARGEYTLEKEREALFAFLQNRGARLLFQEGEHTWIFRID